MELKEEHEFYFAYGANMSSVYLQEYRGIFPIDSKPALVDSSMLIYYVEVDDFINPTYLESSNLTCGQIRGVLHVLTKSDLAKIGEVAPQQYKIVEVLAFSKGLSFKAKALAYLKYRDNDSTRSKDYLNILVKTSADTELSEMHLKN